jgi:hypothetical protein
MFSLFIQVDWFPRWGFVHPRGWLQRQSAGVWKENTRTIIYFLPNNVRRKWNLQELMERIGTSPPQHPSLACVSDCFVSWTVWKFSWKGNKLTQGGRGSGGGCGGGGTIHSLSMAINIKYLNKQLMNSLLSHWSQFSTKILRSKFVKVLYW